MKPEEFVSRMIDSFGPMDMGSFGTSKPKSFASAASAIQLNPAHDFNVEMNGYRWQLLSKDALDHTVIKTTLSDGYTDLTASVCFNWANIAEAALLATWHPTAWKSTSSADQHAERAMCMLTMLTLKTSYRIREIHWPSH